MGIRRINCFADCENCVNAVLVKKNYWGEKIFECNAVSRRHKAINADDCGAFNCRDNDGSLLCRSCMSGEPTKLYQKIR